MTFSSQPKMYFHPALRKNTPNKACTYSRYICMIRKCICSPLQRCDVNSSPQNKARKPLSILRESLVLRHCHTVDGRNPVPLEMDKTLEIFKIVGYLHDIYHINWLQDFFYQQYEKSQFAICKKEHLKASHHFFTHVKKKYSYLIPLPHLCFCFPKATWELY